MGEGVYAVINDFLVARIVVDVDGDAAEGGDLGGELVEAGVVLPGLFGGGFFFSWGGVENAWLGCLEEWGNYLSRS